MGHEMEWDRRTEVEKALLDPQFVSAKLTAEHLILHRLCGSWQGETRTWLDPKKDPDRADQKAVVRTILGGLYVRHEYTGVLFGKPFVGMVVYGYDQSAKAFTSSWIDTFHTGTYTMFSKGQWDEHLQTLTFLGDFPVHNSSTGRDERWGWRTEISLKGSEGLCFKSYNISPAGEEDLGIQTDLRQGPMV